MALLAAGCGASAQPSATTHTATGAVVTPGGRHLSKLSTPGTPKGEQTVRIEVVATSARPTRQTLARGSAGMLQGVTGAASAENFAVASWRAGSVSLPPSMIAAIGSPVAGTGGQLHGPVGLLGSDVLSRYGKIAIDYDNALLVIDPPVK